MERRMANSKREGDGRSPASRGASALSRFAAAFAVAVSTTACGGDDEDPSAGGGAAGLGGGGAPGGAGGSGAGSAAGSGADCAGAFTRAPAPYAPNTTIEEWGGFVADEQGLVFSAIPDSMQTPAPADYPNVLLSSDPTGEVETLYTFDEGSLAGPIFTAGDVVYFISGLLERTLLRMPRAGGEPVVANEERIWSGPARAGSTLYYAARPSFDSDLPITNSSIYALDMASGDVSLVVDLGDTEVAALAVDQGTLFWVETEGLLAESDDTLYSMLIDGGSPELEMTLPRSTALGGFRVIDGVAYGSTLTESLDVQIHRTPLGGTTEIVAEDAGVPMVIADGSAYYGSNDGLVENSLTFDSPSVVPGTAGAAISAIAVGPSDLWYSVGACIYRAPK